MSDPDRTAANISVHFGRVSSDPRRYVRGESDPPPKDEPDPPEPPDQKHG